MKSSDEKRRRWWLLCYAVTSMEKGIDTCRIMIEHCPDNRHELFQSLSLAIHAYYARPFKRSKKVGCRDDGVVPESAKGIHRWLVHFRDGVLSHTDAEHADVAGRPMHDVVYSQHGFDKSFTTSDPRARIDAYQDAQKHCEAMRNIFFAQVLELHEKYKYQMPIGDGDFLLNLDSDGDLFMPHQSPITGNLHYE